MKICILTLPLYNYNYGGILQCYALKTLIANLGHEVFILNRHRNRLPLYKQLAKFALIHICHNKNLIQKDKAHKNWESRNVHLKNFIKQNISDSKLLSSSKELQAEYHRINPDVLIIGSDQVWRPDYAPNIEDYFASFVSKENANIIAYAVSFGKDLTSDTSDIETLAKFNKQASRFKAISVREQSGITICSQLFGTHAVQMPDPCLTLTSEQYRKLYLRAETQKPIGNLFVYILDINKKIKEQISNLATKNNLTPFFPFNESNNYPSRTNDSIEQWLRDIDSAEYVITDSFHGTIFSIIFHKPFFTISNNNRGKDRFISLFKTLKISGRLADTIEDIDIHASAPNWIEVDQCIESMRVNAIDFLNSNIVSSGNE